LPILCSPNKNANQRKQQQQPDDDDSLGPTQRIPVLGRSGLRGPESCAFRRGRPRTTPPAPLRREGTSFSTRGRRWTPSPSRPPRGVRGRRRPSTAAAAPKAVPSAAAAPGDPSRCPFAPKAQLFPLVADAGHGRRRPLSAAWWPLASRLSLCVCRCFCCVRNLKTDICTTSYVALPIKLIHM